MGEYEKCLARRNACEKILGRLSMASVWSTPVVQSIMLPVHAQTSSEVCVRADIVGRWKIELFGPAASVKDVTFYSDGTTDQSFIPVWQFSEGELTMAQGFTWLLTGAFNGCDELTGNYVNTIVIPPLGNIVVRRGSWIASRLDIN